MHQFWNTIKKIKDTYAYRFKLDKKKFRIDTELFHEILHICHRLPNKDFIKPPSKEEMVSFIQELGYSRKCIYRKSTGLDRLRPLRAQILWGMFNQKNVDYVALLCEDFMFQANNKEISFARKENMPYPRFNKVIISHFISKKIPFGLRMGDLRAEGQGMSAKNALVIQRCELSCKELDEFLSFYPIPSQYHVILPTPIQTILDAPPKLNPFGCSKLETFIGMCKAYDCEPSVELFRGFFNLSKAGSWLTFQKRSKKHIPSILAKVITRIEEMTFRNFIYTEDDEDLTFLPKDDSPVRGDYSRFKGSPKGDTFVVHAGSVAARIRERKCKTRGGSSRPPVKRKLASGSSTSCTVRAKDFAIMDDAPVLSISDDDEGLEDCLELKDATAYHLKISIITPPAWKVNKRSRELLKLIEKLSEKISSIAAEAKEHKGNLNRLMLESQKWLGYQVSLSALESKVTSLEAEKANLEATEASLRQEIEEVKHDRREVVSKVVPYACMELLHSDELGRLVGKLVSSAITFGRCRAYEQVARMKEPFDLSKVKGYRPSFAVEEAPTLQKPAPSRTQMHVPSSQLATPSSAPFSKPMSPPTDIMKPSPSPNE
ncbi:hypothetical protein Tco_0650502 [Tanacetum coccineum]